MAQLHSWRQAGRVRQVVQQRGVQALKDQTEVPRMREAAEQLHCTHAGRPMRMQIAQHPDLLRGMEQLEPHVDFEMTNDFTSQRY